MTLNDLPLDEATRTTLQNLAQRQKRSAEEVAAEWLRDSAIYSQEMLSALDTSIADVAADRTTTSDELEAHLRRRGFKV